MSDCQSKIFLTIVEEGVVVDVLGVGVDAKLHQAGLVGGRVVAQRIGDCIVCVVCRICVCILYCIFMNSSGFFWGM